MASQTAQRCWLRDVYFIWNKNDALTWFPSPLAPQQGQLDVVHACALSGPRPALWLQLCVVSGLCVSVSTLNAPYSEACMGVQDCPPPLSLVLFKGLFHFLKPKGGEEKAGKTSAPFFSFCLPVCQALLYTVTPLFSLFSLSCIQRSSLSPLHSLSIHLFSFFLYSLAPIYLSFLPLLPPTERLLKGHAWLKLLCNPGTVTVVWLPSKDVNSVMLWKPIPTRRKDKCSYNILTGRPKLKEHK